MRSLHAYGSHVWTATIKANYVANLYVMHEPHSMKNQKRQGAMLRPKTQYKLNLPHDHHVAGGGSAMGMGSE
ncbi:hypothetical protein AJ87_24320 [Rhizobium yanglingense]|nr:hypothetical protein AJ87_24320 [Rhizobium yanglingense]